MQTSPSLLTEWLLGLCLTAVFAAMGWAQRPAGPLLEEVILNVEANERLYANLEVITRADYRFHGDTKGWPPGISLWLAKTDRYRTISQAGLLYTHQTQSGMSTKGKSDPETDISGYDGLLTRRISQDVANIYHERHELCAVFRPHTYLLTKAHVCLPLSIWLRGGAGLRAHPSAGYYQDTDHRVVFQAEEAIDGLRCFKLRGETWMKRDGKRYLLGLRSVWLAPERNYLPIKTEFYTDDKEAVACEVGTVEDLREVKPGIWFPFRRTITVYDDLESTATNKVLSNVETSTVEKLDLEPNYPLAQFRDIPIPDGSAVYEIQDGRIFKSYVQGAVVQEPAEGAKPAGWRRLLLAALAMLLFVVVAALTYQTRRLRTASKGGAPPAAGQP